MVPYLDISPWQLGPIRVEPFGVLVFIGYVVGLYLAGRRAKQVGLDSHVTKTLVRLAAVFGVAGSHLVHLLAYHPEELLQSPWAVFKIWDGMSSFGGFAGAALAVFVYVRKARITFLPYAEVLLFGFFPCWFFGRIGCSTAHDHPGRLSDFFLAVQYPGGARHDLGFYEVLLSFVWIPFLYYLGRKNKVDAPPRGTILNAMMIAYSVPRFFLDFLRATDLPNHDIRYFGFTPAQYACIAFTAMGVRFLLKQRALRRA